MTTMTTSTTAPATTPEIAPAAASALLSRDEAILVDVREPDEHARERIHGARLVPLAQVTAAKIASLGARRVLIHCKSGRRGADAVARCASLRDSGMEILNIRGGIEAWRDAGLPTVFDQSPPRLSVMQQTQLVIGLGVVAGTALGAFVNPWFLALPAFMGCGLLVAGATGFCGLANLLAVAPWNRASVCKSGCA
jgi:rhodanese-related sulfurtransferase